MDTDHPKTPPRGTLRERKSAEAKRAFFNAAATLFREKGYDATSVDEIAERAGYSRATFFNHFGTKESVLSYYFQFFASCVEQAVDALEPQPNPLERIHQTLAAMLAEAERQREDLRLVYMYRGKDPNYLEDVAHSRRGVWERMTALVSDAQRGGDLRRDVPAKELAYHILSVYTGFMAAVVMSEIPSDQAFRSGWRFILEGARVPAAVGDSPPTGAT